MWAWAVGVNNLTVHSMKTLPWPHKYGSLSEHHHILVDKNILSLSVEYDEYRETNLVIKIRTFRQRNRR